MKYKFLEHTADAKFQAFGKSLEEVFSNAALAMFSIMVNTKEIEDKIEFKINIKGNDLENLLYRWLEELLYLLDTKLFLLSKVKKIKIKNNKLNAIIVGDKFREKYELLGSVKAVTYNEMFVKKEKDKFIVQVVLDL